MLEQEESENKEEGNEDEITETQEGRKGTNEGVDEHGVENSDGNHREYREHTGKEVEESMNEDQRIKGW